MRFLSVCSGIEAASVAWQSLGWEPVAFSEIEAFPNSVLAHHYPTVPNWGDLTKFKDWPDAAIDLLVGGTPCQSFSVAGLRKGLDDPRGNLTLTYLAVAARYRPRWLVWENVPGVLSDATGAFGAFLGGLAELGYGFAYRVLDAQHFGVPQRRRRVFVVGCLGGWRRAAAVLFEPESLSGHPAPSRETGKGVAPTISARPTGGGGLGTDFDCDGGLVANAVSTKWRSAPEESRDNVVVAHALRGEGFDASENGSGRGTPLVAAFAIQERAVSEGASGPDGVGVREGAAYTLEARNKVQAVAFDTTQLTSKENRCNPRVGGPCHPISAAAHAPAVAFANTAGDTALGMSRPGVPPLTQRNGDPGNVLQGMTVRRLTPRECERLQGFPDDYTSIPYRGKSAADGPRYKALGNSMAVPVVRWIGEQIAIVDSLTTKIAA